jgi:hypothetical protein
MGGRTVWGTMSVSLGCHKEREAPSSQQGELRMKRPGIMAISVALAMGLATTAWAAEGTSSGTSGGTSGTGSMNSSGMNSNGSGMKSNQTRGENKGLPGGHSGDDLNKPANGDHGNNGGNGG